MYDSYTTKLNNLFYTLDQAIKSVYLKNFQKYIQDKVKKKRKNTSLLEITILKLHLVSYSKTRWKKGGQLKTLNKIFHSNKTNWYCKTTLKKTSKYYSNLEV